MWLLHPYLISSYIIKYIILPIYFIKVWTMAITIDLFECVNNFKNVDGFAL